MTVNRPPFTDRSEQFKELTTSIEQKHIRRHNKTPGVSRRDENRPSSKFTTISNIVLPLATEMFIFRKKLEECSQDYIFATPAYSKTSSEERERFDVEVKQKLSQFESFINQLGHRVNGSDGLRNATERSHLQRVHEGLRTYLKEVVDFVSLMKKEHLKQLQVKNRSLENDIKKALKNGHVFKYHYGLDELLFNSDLHFSEKLICKLQGLKEKYACIQYYPQKTESADDGYDLIDDNSIFKIAKEERKVEEDDEWDGLKELEFDEITMGKPKEYRESSILLKETVHNSRRSFDELDTSQDRIRESYQRWKNEQGEHFEEKFQQQTIALKNEFVKADRDDEIEKLEQQISEIQSLSSVFSEKIMDQERDIDLINDLALHTSENLIDGNEWIRQAITNSALRRVILLFCIVVLTFTLLFLDWYNP